MRKLNTKPCQVTATSSSPSSEGETSSGVDSSSDHSSEDETSSEGENSSSHSSEGETSSEVEISSWPGAEDVDHDEAGRLMTDGGDDFSVPDWVPDPRVRLPSSQYTNLFSLGAESWSSRSSRTILYDTWNAPRQRNAV